MAGLPAHHEHIDHSTFGSDRFGRFAERAARLLGSAAFITVQSLFIMVWVGLNIAVHGWDHYPFILLNLFFSTQAAYAAPLILLAQTRQADRDKQAAIADAEHLSGLLEEQLKLLKETHGRA